MYAKVNSRLAHALVSKWGGRWRELQLAFFTAYLDDSGSAREHPVAIASALLIPANVIERLDTNWKRFIAAQGIPDFHAAACAAPKSKEKHYDSWDDKKKRHVFMRVRKFCKDYGVQVFGFSVYKKTYDEVMPEDYKRYGGDYYTWALRHVLVKIQEWRQARKIKEPIEYVFDWQEIGDPVRDEIDDLIGQYTEFYKEPIHHDFQQRKKTPALQCADLIAWVCFQLGMEILHKKPMSPYADECLKDLETYQLYSRKMPASKKWFQLITVERPKLKLWITHEISDGHSLRLFEDWYHRHPSREMLLNERKKRISGIRAANAATIKGSSRGDQNAARQGESSKKAEEI